MSGTDVEDERPTPVGSPSPVVDGTGPLPAPSGVDMELAHVFLEVGVLPAMVTPIVEPEGVSAMTPARYPVPPILELPDASPIGLVDPHDCNLPRTQLRSIGRQHRRSWKLHRKKTSGSTGKG